MKFLPRDRTAPSTPCTFVLDIEIVLTSKSSWGSVPHHRSHRPRRSNLLPAQRTAVEGVPNPPPPCEGDNSGGPSIFASAGTWHICPLGSLTESPCELIPSFSRSIRKLNHQLATSRSTVETLSSSSLPHRIPRLLPGKLSSV